MYFRYPNVEDVYSPVNYSDIDNGDYFYPCNYCPLLFREFPPMPPPGSPGGIPRPPFGGLQGAPSSVPQEGPPQGPPPGVPPSFGPPGTTQYGPMGQIKAVSPATLRPCLYRYSFIRLVNGRAFWAWLTHVDRVSVAGWRWNGTRWVYFGMDIRRIASFTCR